MILDNFKGTSKNLRAHPTEIDFNYRFAIIFLTSINFSLLALLGLKLGAISEKEKDRKRGRKREAGRGHKRKEDEVVVVVVAVGRKGGKRWLNQIDRERER